MTDSNQGDLAEALEILMDSLLDAAEEDGEVRDSLFTFRDWIDERLEELEDGDSGERKRERSREPRARREGPSRRRSSDEIDLDLVRQRSLIKAEACRFASLRRRLLERGADPETEIDPHYKDLVGRAKSLPGCYAWPLDSNRQLPGDNELELLARCYENVALGVEIAQRAVSSKGSEGVPDEELLYLLAEAQSSLRAALTATDLRNDEDQIQSYIWVKEQAYDQETYVSRFMRVEDPADPLRWGELRTKLEAYGQKVEGDSEDETDRRARLTALRETLEGLKGERPAAAKKRWGTVFEALDAWVGEGRPAASRELCQILLPWIADVPAKLEVPERAQRVLDATQRMHTAREARAAARTGS